MTHGGDKTQADSPLFDLLERVVDLDAEEREAVLAAVDDDLAAKVRSMLLADESGGELLGGALDEDPPTGESAPPSSIGPYRLLKLLGEGGMGRVYLAEQREPVERRVALKLLRFAVAGQEAEARFAAERQAMGRLEHPNVGTLYEAGTTEDGLPYFVMEHIAGLPITRYCDEKALSIEQRIRLFVGACQGTEHAHRKLLLHRDIKPSNVLVTEVDGTPVSKLIDFGIAKGLDRPLAGATLATGDRMIGTPAYMSPEALGLGGDVDTRTDVFSLGVLLSELLSGLRPWEGKGTSPIEEVRERLGSDPIRPSTRYRRLGPEERMRLARVRMEDERALSGRLRGDLDWIVMSAVASDPDDRYGSAAELADDLERFLRDQPVSARPPSTAYALRKLVQRHRVPAMAAAVALIGVLGGVAAAGVGLVRAQRAEAAALAEAEQARRARDEARSVADFMAGVLSWSGTSGRGDQEPPIDRRLRDVLDRGAAAIDEDLAQQPLHRARLKGVIGTVYRQLGELNASEEHLVAAWNLQEQFGESDATARIRLALAVATTLLRKGEVERAEEYLLEGLEVAPVKGDPLFSMVRAELLATFGSVESRRGNFQPAVEYGERAVRLLREQNLEDREALPSALALLGSTYFRRGSWKEAEALYRESLALFEPIRGPEHSTVANLVDNLAAAIASQGRLEEAAPLFERALAARRKMLGDEHPRIGNSLNNLGQLRFDLGQPAEAESFHREALALREKTLGPEHRMTAWSLDNLARAVAAQERFEEALGLQERAASVRRKVLGAEHDELAHSLGHLGELHLALADLESARSRFAAALAIEEASFGPEHERVVHPLLGLAETEWRLGALETGRAHLERALSVLEAGGEESASELAEARQRFAELSGG